MIRSWISHAFDKTVGSARPVNEGKRDYKLYIPGGGSQSAHISFLSDTDENGLTVKIKLSGEGISCAVFTEAFVPVRGELYPDPLIPYDGSFDIRACLPAVLLLEFTAAPGAAGECSAEISVCSRSGEALFRYIVNIHIWAFDLPDAPYCESAVGLIKAHMAKFHGDSDGIYKAYYDELIKHKLSAYTVPYDILDPRADEYMSDPRVTSFCCDYYVGSYKSFDDDGLVEKIGEKLRSNPEWMRKAYVYPLDEPTTAEHLTELKKRSKRLKRLIPGIHQVIPFYTDIDVSDDVDQIAYMAPLHDIWCPKAALFEGIYSDEQAKKYPPFPQRMLDYQKNGSRIWWYVCNYPQPPYFNIFTNDPGINGRALFWQQYRYGVTGFLYWGANSWGRLDDPWNDTDTFGNDIHGDGILFYPGTKIGINGPVTSLRMKIVRDGIEDFDILTMAGKALGKEYVTGKILSVVPTLTGLSGDGGRFLAVRAEIGDSLEKALRS